MTLAARSLALVALLCAPLAAQAADVHGAPLPRRARALAENHFASPMGFRDTVEWYRKELRRRRVNVEFTGVEKVREVVYLRVLARDAWLGWSAIHIMLAEGRTTIYIVASQNSIGDRLTAGRRTLDPSI